MAKVTQVVRGKTGTSMRIFLQPHGLMGSSQSIQVVYLGSDPQSANYLLCDFE